MDARYIFLIVTCMFARLQTQSLEELVTACRPVKVDLILVIDSSGSVEDIFNAYKHLTLELLDSINFNQEDGPRLSLIQYSKFAYVRQSFKANQTNEAIYDAVQGLQFLGDTTKTADAVHLALEQVKLGRENVTKIVILMTDGNSFDAWDTASAAADDLDKANVKKVLVALGKTVYEPEIKLYTKRGLVFKNGDTQNFKRLLTNATGNCRPPPRTTKPPFVPEIKCELATKVDVVVALDSSGSVDSVFNAYKAQLLKLLKWVPFSADGAHLSLIQYSKAPAHLRHKFNDQQDNIEIYKKVAKLPFLGETTNTADAVSLGFQQFASTGRPDAHRMFILMTDGNSFDQWNVVTQTAQALHESKAKVFVVAFGDIIYQPEVKLYAGNGTIVRKGDLEKFHGILSALMCSKNADELWSKESRNLSATPSSKHLTQSSARTPPSPTKQTISPDLIQSIAATSPTLLKIDNNETSPEISSSIDNIEVSTEVLPELFSTENSEIFSASPAELVASPDFFDSVSSQTESSIISDEQTSQKTIVVVDFEAADDRKAKAESLIESSNVQRPALSENANTSTKKPASNLAAIDEKESAIDQKKLADTVTQPPVPKSCAADIFFILDSSGSVLKDFEKQMGFMNGLIDRLVIDPTAHQVSVLEYSSSTRQRLQFSFNAFPNKDSLKTAIDALPFFSGTTSTGEALLLAKKSLKDRRNGVPLYIFVITDGFSQDDVTTASQALRQEPNSQVFAIGLTEPMERGEMIKIGGDGDHTLFSGDARDLVEKVAAKIPRC